MDDTLFLLILSLAMLIGCYLAGSIPLAFSLSEERLKLITVLGAGLLLGTALAVIIPEGVHALYSATSAKVLSASVADKKSLVNNPREHIHSHGDSEELHTYIGLSLLLGFVVMLLVDQISGGSVHSYVSASDIENGNGSNHRNTKLTATVGLVVHAAADGIALGAAAVTSATHIEIIVFIAIMLHKAPAAFGLVSFLLHTGLDRPRIRRHLMIFSAAAPILAIVTYFGLSQSNKESLADVHATGIAMLFSAGTFLYVAAVHVLPEIQSMGTTRTVSADGALVVREQKGFSCIELTLLVIGSLLPIILSVGHSH